MMINNNPRINKTLQSTLVLMVLSFAHNFGYTQDYNDGVSRQSFRQIVQTDINKADADVEVYLHDQPKNTRSSKTNRANLDDSGTQQISDNNIGGIHSKKPNKQSVNRSVKTPTGPININTASLKELQQLRGIGKARAQDIINYRENVKAFTRGIDITLVNGISTKLFERNKQWIIVQDTPAD